ncbi:MAG: hypothetical protein IKN38_04945, partial [Clostridia bacterium]|nr:hypothetical protein [Clostridia bacterium]
SHSDMRLLVMSLCGNSMYSHTDTICEGYVVTSDGIRAGIAGKAVCSEGVIKSVVNIAAVVIRIPSVRRGFADELYGVMKERSFHDNVLVYSPPSGGKTTLLRELAYRLSSEDDIKKAVVVDTRYEISEGLSGSRAIILYGYPRAKGIEIAVRTLSADVVICDEIGNDEDFEAVSSATGSGVAVVASCHSDKNGGGIMIEKSKERGLFNVYYGINRYGRGHIFRIDTDKV